jgi:hypothetical protein
MIKNPFGFQTQNYRLLEALKYGSVNTQQLLYDLHFASHVRRMKDVKDYLETIGYTIRKKRLNKKSWEYHIELLPEEVLLQWVKNWIKGHRAKQQQQA